MDRTGLFFRYSDQRPWIVDQPHLAGYSPTYPFSGPLFRSTESGAGSAQEDVCVLALGEGSATPGHAPFDVGARLLSDPAADKYAA